MKMKVHVVGSPPLPTALRGAAEAGALNLASLKFLPEIFFFEMTGVQHRRAQSAPRCAHAQHPARFPSPARAGGGSL